MRVNSGARSPPTRAASPAFSRAFRWVVGGAAPEGICSGLEFRLNAWLLRLVQFCCTSGSRSIRPGLFDGFSLSLARKLATICSHLCNDGTTSHFVCNRRSKHVAVPILLVLIVLLGVAPIVLWHTRLVSLDSRFSVNPPNAYT